MTQSTITKTLNNPELNNPQYSLGFQRFTVLPRRIRKSLALAHLIETGSTNSHERIVMFFSDMTQEEYITYLKSA